MMNISKAMFAVALTAAMAACGAAQNANLLGVEMNRPDAVYAVGEEVEFKVTVSNLSGVVRSGDVSAVLDAWGRPDLLVRKVDLAKENPFTVRYRAEKPCFLRLRIEGKNMPAGGAGYIGAAVAPDKIRQTGPEPSDFDAYWASEIARLEREVPLDPQIELDPKRSTGKVEFYRVSFATFGRRVRGFVSVPKDRSKAPFRTEFEIASAGEGPWTLDWSGALPDDHVHLYGLVHDVDMRTGTIFHGDNLAGYMDPNAAKGDCKAIHAALSKALKEKYGHGSYCRAGLDRSREDYYFHSVILGWNRAVDWLHGRKFVDKNRFGYRGGSQGGLFGWYLAGLNHKFRYAAMYVPGGSDLLGFTTGRIDSFPHFGGLAAHTTPEGRARLMANLPYFDGANFAARIRCPIRVSVGFIDWCCDPTSVYAAYNRVKTEKDIVHGVRRGHGTWPEMYQLHGWHGEPK